MLLILYQTYIVVNIINCFDHNFIGDDCWMVDISLWHRFEQKYVFYSL